MIIHLFSCIAHNSRTLVEEVILMITEPTCRPEPFRSVQYKWHTLGWVSTACFVLHLDYASIVCPLFARLHSVPDNALQVVRFGSLLFVIHCFSTVAVCVVVPIRASEQRAVTSCSTIPFCLLLFFLCQSLSYICFPLFFVSVLLSLSVFPLLPLYVPSPLFPSPLMYLSSSLVHLLPCIFTPILPYCHFRFFCLLCFVIFFYLRWLHGGLTEKETHMGKHT